METIKSLQQLCRLVINVFGFPMVESELNDLTCRGSLSHISNARKAFTKPYCVGWAMDVSGMYEFDDVVLREILGKKLSLRNWKNLDEVSEKTHAWFSCTEYSDAFSASWTSCQNFVVIILQFRKYAAIVFITNNRFETDKQQQVNKNEKTDVDLDREFLQNLRKLKILLEKDHLEEHCGYYIMLISSNTK
uniref:Uncharacterized protein n=1 Tax=Strigamia maritima TaxID=126957 RepID=T1IHE0_STRMM